MTELTNEQMVDALESTGKYKILQKYQKKAVYNQIPENTKTYTAAMLDVETTGLSPATDEVINLAIVLFEYGSDGTIFKLKGLANEFQQPSNPISQQITDLTSITDEMVKGKSINKDKIRGIIDKCDIIVAHNAAFDRKFFDKLFPEFSQKIWCCSQTQIPWKSFGLNSAKQVLIAYHFNMFYDEHLAQSDCLAAIDILSRSKNGKTMMSYLVDSLDVTNKRYVHANKSEFSKKDLLKARGYTFNSEKKLWSVIVPIEMVEAEQKYLSEFIYRGADLSSVEAVNRQDIFKG